MTINDWWIYKGNGQPYSAPPKLPLAPKWRRFKGKPIPDRVLPAAVETERGAKYQANDLQRELINTALFLRRPLLVTGRPGSGKSTLAYSVAYELNLGPVLHWPITSRTTLQDGLYHYDAIARLHEASLHQSTPDIGGFVRLGPLGTALIPSHHPRVLLIDEIDKSDIDFPNDLLNVFEEGEFEIPELARLADKQAIEEVLPGDGGGKVKVERGRIRCHEFPLVIMTSNEEREFPAAFLRRCLRLHIQPPEREELEKIVEARLDLDESDREHIKKLITLFLARRDEGDRQELATDQLLNAIYMVTQGVSPLERTDLLEGILRRLDGGDTE